MRRFAGIAAVAVALASAACGDDDRLTAEEFVEQANERCAAFRLEDDAAAEEAFSGDAEPSEEDIQAFLDGAIPRVQELLDDLDDLEPPAELADDVDALLEDGRAALAELEAGGAALLLSGEDPFEEVDRQALALGLDNCVDDAG
jgi:hypothetical protein